MGRDLDREGRSLTWLAPDRNIATMDRGDVLHDGEPEAVAAIGPAARIVHSVEAFEDSIDFCGWDPDAVVRHGDLDVVVVAPGLDMRGDNNTGARVGICHGVLHKIADRYTELARAAQHSRPGNPGHGEGDPIPLGVEPAAIHRFGQHVVYVNDLRIGQRVVGLKSGQLDDLTYQVGQPSGLDTQPAGELAYGRRVVSGTFNRLGEQRDRADGRFELVTDVCDEVPPGFLNSLSGCLIVREDENQALVQWRHASGEVDGGNAYASVDLKIDGLALAIATNAADELEQLRDRDAAPPNQAQRPRRRGRLKDLVVRSDHDSSGRQRCENLCDASRDDRLGDIEGRSRLCLSAPQRSPCEQRADPYADNDRNNADPNRVHTKIVGVEPVPAHQVIGVRA